MAELQKDIKENLGKNLKEIYQSKLDQARRNRQKLQKLKNQLDERKRSESPPTKEGLPDQRQPPADQQNLFSDKISKIDEVERANNESFAT